MTTGVTTVNAGLNLRKGRVLCTGEIPHGMGPGIVYVNFGIENTTPVEGEKQNITDLLIGDATLFASDADESEYHFDRGVRLHPEKGTFELALRLKEDLNETSLQLRWFAWRPENFTLLPKEDGVLIRLEPDVVYAVPGQTIQFAPVFQGTNQRCEFTVGKKSGIITEDGLYTAPKRKGLYKISAHKYNEPASKVSAFVIVGAQEEGGDHDSAVT